MSLTYQGLCRTWHDALRNAELWATESGRRMRIYRKALTPGGDMARKYGQEYGWWIDEVDVPSLGERLAAAHIAEAKARAGLEVTA